MTDNHYILINGHPEDHFPAGYRYYDEGIAAFEAGQAFNPHASLSWKDGYRDMLEQACGNAKRIVK